MILRVAMTLSWLPLIHFKITGGLIILNKENLTQFLVLKTQIKVNSAKLLKT